MLFSAYIADCAVLRLICAGVGLGLGMCSDFAVLKVIHTGGWFETYHAGVGLCQVLKLIGAVVGLGLSCIRIYSTRAKPSVIIS